MIAIKDSCGRETIWRTVWRLLNEPENHVGQQLK